MSKRLEDFVTTTMKRIFTILLAFLFIPLAVMAEEVSFHASAPRQAIAGKPFQLTYTVNQRAKDLRAPEMADFEILAGPYTSQSSSTQFINGKRSSTFTLTYTYTLLAQQTGVFTIQPATITVDGERYTSNGLKIEVLPADQQPTTSNQGAQRQSGQSAGNQQQADVNLSADNIFIRTLVNKTRVHEQECILLSYKLYFAGVDVAQFTNNTKIPEFTGFLKQEMDLGDIQTELEHYNGRNYQTAILFQTLLYPQHAGDIQIEPATFEAIIRVQNRAQVRSIFDDFFGSYTNVSKVLKAPGVKIKVDALPAGKPAGFSGGVGQFNIHSAISTKEMKTNEAVTLKLEITGTGNMKLLKTPAIDWPEGFEVYDPKVNNNFKNTTAGVNGTKTIEYLAIPRAAGDWTIPAITFSYYDIQADEYRTLTTPVYTLHVERGASDQTIATEGVPYVGKEDIRALGTDIRYITTTQPVIVALPLITLGSLGFWLCYLVPLLLAVILFIVFRRQIRENADIRRVRYKKANMVAQKRLRKAKKLLDAGEKETFYEEIERAAWTYLSDRLSIPTAELNKENIATLLREKGIAEELIKEVVNVLSTAEFARYAPTMAGDPKDVYTATVKLIDQLEDSKI